MGEKNVSRRSDGGYLANLLSPGKIMILFNLLRVTVVLIILFSIYLFGYTWEGFKGGVEYSAYPSNSNIDTYTGALVDQTKNNSDCKRVWGYNGLFCSPETGDKLFDPFFGSGSSMTCEGSGITKSGGNVCLNAEQRRLLTTRGGNSSPDSQIG